MARRDSGTAGSLRIALAALVVFGVAYYVTARMQAGDEERGAADRAITPQAVKPQATPGSKPPRVATRASAALRGAMRTFTDRVGGYRVSYPIAWRLKDNNRAKHMIRADLTWPRHNTGIQIRICKSGGLEFAKYVDWHVAQFTKAMARHHRGKFSAITKEFGPIGKHDGCRVGMVLTRSDMQKWLLKQYLWPRGKQVYVFQCGTPYKLRAKGEPALDAIAETFEFVE